MLWVISELEVALQVADLQRLEARGRELAARLRAGRSKEAHVEADKSVPKLAAGGLGAIGR